MIPGPEPIPATTESLTPLVRQLASQLRATRSSSAVARSFPERENAARPDLGSTLDAITRASEQSRSRGEALTLLRQQLEQAEAKLAATTERLADAESRLRGAQDDSRRERTRADDLERRSAEILQKSQELLTDAGERLEAAEARAATAEADLAYLKDVIRERLGA